MTVVFSSPDIVNPASVSIESSGKKRIILDLKHINAHVHKQKFEFDGRTISFSPLI